MTINNILIQAPYITREQFILAYNAVIRQVMLRPLLLTVTTNIVNNFDLTKDEFTIGGDYRYKVKIKEITEIICKDRLSTQPTFSEAIDSPDVTYDLGVSDTVSGSVYYVNNTVTTTEPSVFLITCYCVPLISNLDDGVTPRGEGDEYIPDHLVILAITKAMSVRCQQRGDVDGLGRFEAIYTQLVNAYNINIMAFEPKTNTPVGVTPYGI